MSLFAEGAEGGMGEDKELKGGGVRNIINDFLMRIYSGISIESTMRSFMLLRPTSRCPRTCRNKTTFSIVVVVAVADLFQIELNFFLISFRSSLPKIKWKSFMERVESEIDSSI